MFVSKLSMMQFVDSENGQRSEPFIINPNEFPKRVEGFNDEMLQNTLVLVLADCSIDDSGNYAMSAVSRFPIVSADTLKQCALDNIHHRAFSDSDALRVVG